MENVSTFKVFKLDSTDSTNSTIDNFLKKYGIKVTFSEIFYTPPKTKMPIHNDSIGVCTKLNWIFGADGSLMQWWKQKNGYKPTSNVNAIGNQYLSYDELECDCVWQTQVGKPSLVNVGIPHSITNMTDEGRWCMSYVLYDIDKNQYLEWNGAVEKLYEILK